jgi:predicted metal-dependent hydrolase
MQRWYLDHARSIFMRQMTALVRQTPRLELEEAPQLLVRKLQMRWGSCSPERRILMNVDVVKLPVGCIDYLLMHELCHLRIPHHGPEFWRLLAACMPDWERWRSRLDTAEI